jgi:hypothetical protein
MTRGHQDHGRANQNKDRDGADQDRAVHAAADRLARVQIVRSVALQGRIGQDKNGKPGMPDDVEPSGALGTGPEQSGRREYAGEGQRVYKGDGGGEQIAAGEDEESGQSQEAKLAEEQDRRDQVADDQRGFVSRNESGNGSELHRRVWQRSDKERRGRQHRRQRKVHLSAIRRGDGHEQAGVVALHDRPEDSRCEALRVLGADFMLHKYQL